MVKLVTLILLVTAALLCLNVVLHNRQRAHNLNAVPDLLPSTPVRNSELAKLQNKAQSLHSLLTEAQAQVQALTQSRDACERQHEQGNAARDLPFAAEPRGWYEKVEDIPAGSTVWVTFVNGDVKYREMMMNWAYHLRQLNVPHLVIAFDDVAADVCKDASIPFLRHVETLVSGDFRADFTKFRKMGSNKPLIVLKLLEEHNIDTVIISDVDTAWMRNPTEFLLRHPTADVLISTDCLSHWIEEQYDAASQHSNAYFHRCGHLPGATFGRAFNTGVIIFRHRPATLEILREWRKYLTDPETMYAPSNRGGAFAITDQLAFNIILERNIAPITSTEEDWRVILAMDHKLKLMPLPSLLFTNGHVFFYQHLPRLHNVKAYVVHCTFQRHHTPGKRARLREEGLWLVDPPEYFQAERLMTYKNDVMDYITALQLKASGTMSDLFKHFHAMSYQLAALRDAFALARALNRTLVLPRFICYCDQDWYASILIKCRVDGSDLSLPYVCPLDMLVNPGNLDAQPLPYRMESYLTDARTSQRIKQSQEEVVIDSHAEYIAYRRQHMNGAGSWLVAGAKAGRAIEDLAATREVHIVTFNGLRPGTFDGFDTQIENEKFDAAFKGAVTIEAKWCCTGEQPIDVGWITWWYILPKPFSEQTDIPWKVAQYPYPSHCDKIKNGDAGQLNIDFLRYDNHPCTFLGKNISFPHTLEDVLPSSAQLKLPQPR